MIRFDNHAFKGLDHALHALFTTQTTMADALRAMIALLPDSLSAPTPELFVKAKQIDKTINEAEAKADTMAAEIIAKFTISGEELRFVIGALKVSGTLERVADKTKNCIKHLGKLTQPASASIQADLHKAARSLAAMVPLCMAQLVDYQEVATRELLHHGGVVQQNYKQVLLQLHQQSTRHVDETHLTLIAKNLEQAADMLVEIMKISHHVHLGSKYQKEPG